MLVLPSVTARGCVVLPKPTSISWNVTGKTDDIFQFDVYELHNESGPSVVHALINLWHIHNIKVDEQIVMAPETQTIHQIESEESNDVRSIRIERFGWHNYIQASNADELDGRFNHVEGTREALYNTTLGRRFIATCPSGNGRIVSLSVPDAIMTCEQACNWLAGDKPFNVLART